MKNPGDDNPEHQNDAQLLDLEYWPQLDLAPELFNLEWIGGEHEQHHLNGPLPGSPHQGKLGYPSSDGHLATRGSSREYDDEKKQENDPVHVVCRVDGGVPLLRIVTDCLSFVFCRWMIFRYLMMLIVV